MKYLKYILLFIAILPILIFRDFTPDNELRYLSIADEAIKNGHIFAFFNQGIPYADKPPLFMWLLMLYKNIFGEYSMFGLSLLSILPGVIILEVMDNWVKSKIENSSKLVPWLILVSTVYFIGSMIVIRMDMLMAMFIILSLRVFFRIYEGSGKKYDTWLLGLLVFMALFTKGPFGLMILVASILAFLAFKRKIKEIGKYLGWRFWLIIILLATTWLIAVYVEAGKQYIYDLVYNQTVNRAIDSFSHKKGLLFYIESFPVIFAPWSLLFLSLFILAIKTKLIKSNLEQFFAIIILTTFVMLSCVSAKLEIYLLPIIPFVAYLAGIWLQRNKVSESILIKVGIIVPIIILTLAFPVYLFLYYRSYDMILNSWGIILSSATLSIFGIISLFFFFRTYSFNKILLTIVIGMFSSIFIASFFMKDFNKYIGYGELANNAEQMAENYKIDKCFSYDIPRASGMNIYLDKNVIELDKSQLSQLSELNEGYILFIKTKSTSLSVIESLLTKYKHKEIGNYIIIVVNKN